MNEFDEMTKTMQALGDKKREVFQQALKYFNVPKEESQIRVKIYYSPNSIEKVYIDDVLALTFSPVRIGLDGKVQMDIQENYKEKKQL